MSCVCGEVERPGVRYCSAHHGYYLGERKFTSITSVIHTVYPKRSFDGAPEDVIEHARERGVRVDAYLSKYAEDGIIEMDPDEWPDVIERVDITTRWWDENISSDYVVTPQPILFSLADGIAGASDFIVDVDSGGWHGSWGIDLKNQYSKEKYWILQLGAAAHYGALDKISILHVSPKVYKKTGCSLIDYDLEFAKRAWQQCVGWWKMSKEIEANG